MGSSAVASSMHAAVAVAVCLLIWYGDLVCMEVMMVVVMMILIAVRCDTVPTERACDDGYLSAQI